MSQEQLKKSFEKITESMKIVAQDFEYVAKLFEGRYQRYWFQQTYSLSIIILSI